MEKCSSKEHKEIDAVFYCQNCKIYMCNKCDLFHSNIFQNHLKLTLDKDKKEIFTGFCKVKSHNNELIFFCKNHNKLCCSSCISKIKTKEYGQHTDCNVCKIEEIKEEKKNKFEENIKYLEKMSIDINKSINDLKLIYDKINENKENLKLKVQQIFTKLRSTLNEREDELLLIIDEKYKSKYIDENIIKEKEKIPFKIKSILEKNKIENKKWNNETELNKEINECLEVEENINKIKKINSTIEQFNSNKININFSPNEDKINELINSIKNFGEIYSINPLICSICSQNNNLKKCLCKKIFCQKCLDEKKNVECIKSCYLFNNDLNYINQIYNKYI